MLKLFLSKFFFLVLIFPLFVSGCSQESGFKKHSMDAPAQSYQYYPETGQIAYLKGAFPRKVFFQIYDTASHKSRKIHLDNYLIQSGELLPNSEQIVLNAYYRTIKVAQAQILLVDAKTRKKISSQILSGDTVIKMIRWLPSTSEILLVLQSKDPNRIFLKTWNPETGELSDSKFLYEGALFRAFLLKSKPYLILDVSKKGVSEIVVYDLRQDQALLTIPNMSTSLDFIESEGVLYGLFQSPGDSRGKLLKVDFENQNLELIATLDGEVETFLFVNGLVFVIAKDLKRANEQKRHWLHPRNLHVVNVERKEIIKTLAWTERRGELVGFNPQKNEIYYAVIDSDAPALWIINNDPEVLSRVSKTIR